MYEPLIHGAHLVAAVFASWRLTELIVMDKAMEPVRKRFPIYLLTCLRCVSVWAGLAAVLVYLFFPWANWPFALSWIYIQYMDGKVASRQKKEGRRLVVMMDDQDVMTLLRSELTPLELDYLMAQMKQGLKKSVA